MALTLLALSILARIILSSIRHPIQQCCQESIILLALSSITSTRYSIPNQQHLHSYPHYPQKIAKCRSQAKLTLPPPSQPPRPRPPSSAKATQQLPAKTPLTITAATCIPRPRHTAPPRAASEDPTSPSPHPLPTTHPTTRPPWPLAMRTNPSHPSTSPPKTHSGPTKSTPSSLPKLKQKRTRIQPKRLLRRSVDALALLRMSSISDTPMCHREGRSMAGSRLGGRGWGSVS